MHRLASRAANVCGLPGSRRKWERASSLKSNMSVRSAVPNYGLRNRGRWSGGVLHDRVLLPPIEEMLANRAYRRSLAPHVLDPRCGHRHVDALRSPEV